MPEKWDILQTLKQEALKTNSSYNIGVVYIDKSKAGLKHEYFSTMLSSIQEKLTYKGTTFTIYIQPLVKVTTNTHLLSHADIEDVMVLLLLQLIIVIQQILNLMASDMKVSSQLIHDFSKIITALCQIII